MFLAVPGAAFNRRLDAMRVGPKAELMVKVPNSTDKITMKDSDKHFGEAVAWDRGILADAAVKVRSALAACLQIAIRVFGSQRVGPDLKFILMNWKGKVCVLGVQ